jgi:hypothetical protein
VASPDGCVWTASIDGDVDVWRVKNERHVSKSLLLNSHQHRHHTSYFTIMLLYTIAQYYCLCFCELVNNLSIRHLSACVIFFNDVLVVTLQSCMLTLCLLLITHRLRPQVRTVKMLAQAVCGMTVCQNGAAGVNCMWAASYDGELSSWVIDDLCVPPPNAQAVVRANFVDKGLKIRAQVSGSQRRTRNSGNLWS